MIFCLLVMYSIVIMNLFYDTFDVCSFLQFVRKNETNIASRTGERGEKEEKSKERKTSKDWQGNLSNFVKEVSCIWLVLMVHRPQYLVGVAIYK